MFFKPKMKIVFNNGYYLPAVKFMLSKWRYVPYDACGPSMVSEDITTLYPFTEKSFVVGHTNPINAARDIKLLEMHGVSRSNLSAEINSAHVIKIDMSCKDTERISLIKGKKVVPRDVEVLSTYRSGYETQGNLDLKYILNVLEMAGENVNFALDVKNFISFTETASGNSANNEIEFLYSNMDKLRGEHGTATFVRSKDKEVIIIFGKNYKVRAFIIKQGNAIFKSKITLSMYRKEITDILKNVQDK